MKFLETNRFGGISANNNLVRPVRKFIGGLLLILTLIPMLDGNVRADERATQQEFSRFSVLERARFFESAILTAAINEGVDPNLLWTIAYNETRFRPWLRSPAGAEGMMQFIPSTAARYNLLNPYDALAAIKASARYVKYLSNLFGGRVDSILAAYNAGEGTVTAYLNGNAVRVGQKIINSRKVQTIGGIPPYAETVGYVGRGLMIYRWLIERRVFPARTAIGKLPNAISAAVARVNLRDDELGFVSQFRRGRLIQIAYQSAANNRLTNRNYLSQTALSVDSTAQNAASEQQDANPKDETNLNVVTFSEAPIYYDLQTGNRYLIRSKNEAVKLAENGQIIVSRANRNVLTTARSTFAGSATKSR